MKSKFIFDKVRKSTSHNNKLAIQGFCDEEFLNTFDVQIQYKYSGGERVLEFQQLESNIPAIKRIEIKDISICKMLTYIVDIPDDFEEDGTISLVGKNNQDDTTIYQCSGRKAKQALRKLNASFDNAYIAENKLMVSGWALDCSKLEFELLKGSKKGASIDSLDIERTSRSDVAGDYPEYKIDKNVGFLIKTELEEIKDFNGKLYLKVTAGDISYIQRLHWSEGGAKIDTASILRKNMNKFVYCLRNRGLKVTLQKVRRRLFYKLDGRPKEYNQWYKEHKVDEETLEKQRGTSFDYQPTFSILVPLYETDKKYLDDLINSVKAQTYSRWQLCFSDGSKDSNRLKNIIAEYSKNDNRIEYVAEKAGPLGISANTNQALTIAKGEYIVLGDHDDIFSPDALYECVKVLNDNKCDVIYTDEDKVDKKGKIHYEPNFKPDYNVDLLRSNNYICHMFVASRALVEKVGMFDNAYDGAQDYDFILRCVEQADRIHHIPKILYHWRCHKASTADNPEAKLYAFEAGKKALEAHYKRMGLEATVEAIEEYGFYKTNYKINGSPKISIVIPNKDHIDDLKKCMNSIDNYSEYRNYEFIIVENNSTEKETFDYYKELESRDNVKVLNWDKEFNYSAINNYGVKSAEGEYVLLLNNDTEIINKDCLTQLLSYCQREDVGIVGARLYYEDGSIQHAGVVIGFGGIAGHAFVGLYEENGLYMSRTKVACDYSAVTAACLMVKKSIFEQVGGLDESFKVAFNDIDFCMKVRELGKLVVYNANAKLYHYESKSRGYEDTPEKQERFFSEIERFTDKWPEILKNGDPYYNVNLTLNSADFSVKG